jgi:hypothetical protein
MRSREFWRECDIPPKLSLILLVGAALLYLAGCESRDATRDPDLVEHEQTMREAWAMASNNYDHMPASRFQWAMPLPLTNATGTALVVSDSVSCCLLRAGESRGWTPGGGPVEITAPEGYDMAAESTVTDTGPLPDPGTPCRAMYRKMRALWEEATP